MNTIKIQDIFYDYLLSIVDNWNESLDEDEYKYEPKDVIETLIVKEMRNLK